MDLATILGLGVAAVSIITSFLMDGGHLSALFNVSALLIIFGGTIGATLVSFPMEEVLRVPRLLILAATGRTSDPTEIITRFVELAEKARREGLLILQNSISDAPTPLFARGLGLVVDGAQPETVREVLEADVAQMAQRHHVGASIMETAGGYAPTMGIIGTVMGLIHVLSNLEDASELGHSIAVAFLATLYGIASANLFFLPIAGKLKARSRHEQLVASMVITGLLALQSGENPTLLRERLMVFVAPNARRSSRTEGDGFVRQAGA